MRHIVPAIALVILSATTATAQAGHEGHAMPQKSAMASSCPLHLTTLGLDAKQAAAADSIRADHEAIMKSIMPMQASGMKMESGGKAMESTMRLTIGAMRSLLTPAQRVTFDAAVETHKAEMAAAKAKGDHDCMACCMECMGHQHPAAVKKNG
jgi:hypothetical protein